MCRQSYSRAPTGANPDPVTFERQLRWRLAAVRRAERQGDRSGAMKALQGFLAGIAARPRPRWGGSLARALLWLEAAP